MDLQTLAAALAISDKRIAASSPSASSEPPDAPKENDLWVDTGVSPHHDAALARGGRVDGAGVY